MNQSEKTTTNTSTGRPKVALGMSGGVDSSLAAHLLLEQGYDVTGVYLECWRAPGCRTDQDRQDALKVALGLGIPFQVLDFKQAYRDTVVEYFFQEYAAGRTPNPDVMCNKEIKFGLFYDWAMSHGFDFVATGHYAQITSVHNQPALTSAVDTRKDQTYFLYLLQPNQLAHTLFPIGHLTKPQVRQEATKRQLHVATKKDSVGICFIGDINVHEFLRERLGENPGAVVDAQGHEIGTHQGLWFYTVGQRHGFTINKKMVVTEQNGETLQRTLLPPFYVIRKEPATNQLVVGFGSETERDQFPVHTLHWQRLDLLDFDQQPQVLVRIRHTGQLFPATIKKVNHDQAIITLAQPIAGIAEGQAAVVYLPHPEHPDTHVCVGGGVIG